MPMLLEERAMTENDDDDLGPCDSICERAEVIRGIAADLETKNNKDARRLLIQAAETVLLHMRPPSAGGRCRTS